MPNEQGNTKNYEQRMKTFGQNNRPFCLVDLENGRFSLCLSLDFLSGKYRNYGQKAFNAYAREIGDPVKNQYGLYTHGNGHEWERVFQKAFAEDPRLSEIEFDSEAGGFFCTTADLSLLERYGSAFREIVEDTEAFRQLVLEALTEQTQENTLEQGMLEG